MSPEHARTDVSAAAPPNELIVEILREGVWTIDLAGTTTYVNARMAGILGYEPAEMIGREVFSFMGDAERAIVEAKLARRRQGIREEYESRLQRRDGTEVWARLSVSPIAGPAGEYRGAIALVTDITEERRAESELRATTARFQGLFELTTDAVAFFDIETLQVLDANEAALGMYGLSRDELEGLSIADVTTTPQTARAFAKEAVAGSSLAGFRRWHRRSDGAVFPAEVTTGVFDLDQRLVGFAVVRDVSTQVELEDALRRERDHNRALIAAVQDGLVETDLEGVVTAANDQFCAMTGFSRTELIGSRPPRPYWPSQFSDQYLDAAADVLAGTEGTWELTLRRADGETFPAVVVASAIRGAGGEVTGYLGFFRDLTEHRRAAAALHQAELDRQRYAADLERQRLEVELARAQRLESLGRLAGGIAHDFNNQLGLILNCAAFISKDLDADSQVAGDVAVIRQAAERAAALTRRLLLIGSQEPTQPVVFDLNGLARETVHLVTRLFGPSIHVETHFAAESCWVEADRSQLEQVVMNLLLNARDALADGGRITVATAHADPPPGPAALEPSRPVHLTISDNGIGMAPEVLTRAFEPFFTTKAPDHGSGLGLATAHSVITDAGGRIEIDSQPGVGTYVRVDLPSTDALEAVERTAGHGETVLVVDDEPEVRTMTSRILREGGYEVIEAGSAQNAIARAQTAPVHLLVTDIVMPGVTGDVLAAELVREQPDLKTLFMSVHAPETLDDAVRRSLVEKPFTRETILEAVRRVLNEPAGPSTAPPRR